MKKKLKVRKFKSESRERAFWARMNLAEYFEPADFEPVMFPNLRPTSQPISLRIPLYLLSRVKEHANELHIPYQTLIKQYIAQSIVKER